MHNAPDRVITIKEVASRIGATVATSFGGPHGLVVCCAMARSRHFRRGFQSGMDAPFKPSMKRWCLLKGRISLPPSISAAALNKSFAKSNRRSPAHAMHGFTGPPVGLARS